jgi:peptide/nickel transport system ATP-binding protein
MAPPLLQLENVVRHYRLPRESLLHAPATVRAVEDVTLAIETGRSLGVVGESGSGKSTLARLAMALEPPTAGRVLFEGRDLNRLARAELRRVRRDFQMVFQDPYGSLDPRQTVARIVAEPLAALDETSPAQQREQAAAMLDAVGLRTADMDKYPHEFSGGQRQRVAIARALLTRPKLIVADEPVSALDVSVQAQVLNLLNDLQAQFGVTYLLISHDLAVVDHVCDEVAVMYRGRVVEHGPAERLFRAAAHPYTRALLDAVPKPVPRARTRRPAPPAADADGMRSGCPFADRCPYVEPRCRTEAPALRRLAGDHAAACHFAERIMAQPGGPQVSA